MDIDKLKDEFKKKKVTEMDFSIKNVTDMKDFFQRINAQDREDEKYLLHNQVIPIIIGLFLITIIMLINPIKTFLLLLGMFLIFIGLVYTLILKILDYKDISRGSYDLSMFAYLKQKKERLKSWHSTPSKYKWTFTVFVSGVIFMVIGNTGPMQEFGIKTTVIFIVVYLCLIIISWNVGEYFYKKRHRQKHEPLIKIISEQLKELDEGAID